MSNLVIIDGNMMVHRAFNVMPDLEHSETGEHTGAVYGVANMLLKLIDSHHPEFIVVCFDRPEPTFRHKIYPLYKHKEMDLEMLEYYRRIHEQIPRIKQLFETFGIPIFECPGYEADDLCGAIASQASDMGIGVLVMTEDNDMLQLVDNNRNIAVLKKDMIVDEDYVTARFNGLLPSWIPQLKALCGDASDNIPNIPGIGEITAIKVLQFGSIDFILNSPEAVIENSLLAVGADTRVKTAVRKVRLMGTQVMMSRALATISIEVPVVFRPGEATLVVSFAEVLQLFNDLQFKNLERRVLQMFGTK